MCVFFFFFLLLPQKTVGEFHDDVVPVGALTECQIITTHRIDLFNPWRRLERGLEAVAFAGSGVELGGDVVEHAGAVEGQVGALGQVLAQQAVGVLVGAALPGRVRVAEVDVQAGGLGDLDVVGHLPALVPGQGQPQLLGQGGHLRDQCFLDRERAVASGRCSSITNPVVRSTRVPTAVADAVEPRIRSPSQCPVRFMAFANRFCSFSETIAGGLPVLVHVVSQRAQVLRLRRTEQPLACSVVARVAFLDRNGVGVLFRDFSKLNSPAH